MGGQKAPAWERAGEMTECGRELQLWGRGGFYVAPNLEVKAWQRQEEETEQVEGEDLAIFFPASPRPLLSPQTSVSSHLVVMETGWNRTDGLH